MLLIFNDFFQFTTTNTSEIKPIIDLNPDYNDWVLLSKINLVHL